MEYFSTNILRKLFEKVIYSKMSNNITNCMSPYQAIKKSKLLAAALDHTLYSNLPITLVIYDFKQCLGSLLLQYSMMCL